MYSLEAWTVPGCGSLSFLAIGGICEGDSIHDCQQPHDLVMELAVDYDRPLKGDWRWQVYAGLAGEPALGPPSYTHRVSALGNPIGPIASHWVESTHVAFGLVTFGAYNRHWKVETSIFNGPDPDESRVDLDLGAFDSAAGRLSFLPTDRVALQVSVARVRNSRADSILAFQGAGTRLSASATYHHPIAANGIWATTLAYGANHAREIVSGALLDTTTDGALIESSATLWDRHTVFVRGEVGGMLGHHLHAVEYSASVLSVGRVQSGYVLHLPAVKGLVPGIGGAVAVSILPPELAPRYSGRTAPGLSIFFHLQAARHQM